MYRAESRLALVDYEQTESEGSDDGSSGYGSTPDLSDTEATTTLYGSHKTEGILVTEPKNGPIKNKMIYRNIHTLSEQLRFISSVPELCDVAFEVGPEKVKVHGVKAILGTRSRVLYNLILKKQREEELQKKQDKKKKKNTNLADKVIITVKKYQPEDFQKIIQFIHCGSVDINTSNIPGILCGASQFGLDDLTEACWDFVNQCVKSRNVDKLFSATKNYANFKVAQMLIEKIKCSIVRSVTV